MTNAKRRLIIFLIGSGCTLLLAGLLPLFSAAQDAAPESTPEADSTPLPENISQIYDLKNVTALQPTGNNSYCILCHNQPLQTVTMQDGNILNLYVNPEIITNSVHGPSAKGGALGCVDCHGEDSFPHSGPTPLNQREYTLKSVTFCIGCHVDQVEGLLNGLHEQAIAAGNTRAAVCTDCHGVHSVQPVAEFPELVAGVCGDCHETTLAEWRSSAHVEIGPLDCATCHSPHSQRLRVGRTVDDLCLNCHKDMREVFTHTQHNSQAHPVGCADCHMFVPESPAQALSANASAVPMSTGHTVIVETVACNTCHEQLVTSGEWERITTLERTDSSAAQMTEETQAEGGTSDGFLPLIQGLILGIGFGITAAAVFISRGNRPITPPEA